MAAPSIECKEHQIHDSYDSIENLTKGALSLNNSLLQSHTPLNEIASTL